MVADTVAAPIEQQVTGVEGMLYMSSQMGNDGTYSLTVTFDVGTDLNTALVMVQNRVRLAMPLLPTQVQNQGITIRKKTPDILMIISLYSPDQRYDDLYLSNYALINLRDEVLRVDGVADVNIFGERDYSIRVWLDPQKMAALGINAGDVATAIGNQNLDVSAGQLGTPPAPANQPFEIPIAALGRLSEPEQFGDIIVKVGHGSSPAAAVVQGQGIADPLQTAGNMGTSTGGAALSVTNSSAGLTAIAALVRGTTGRGAASTTMGTTTGGATTTGGVTTGGGMTGGGQQQRQRDREQRRRDSARDDRWQYDSRPQQFIDDRQCQWRCHDLQPDAPPHPAATRSTGCPGGWHRPASRRRSRGNGCPEL